MSFFSLCVLMEVIWHTLGASTSPESNHISDCVSRYWYEIGDIGGLLPHYGNINKPGTHKKYHKTSAECISAGATHMKAQGK